MVFRCVGGLVVAPLGASGDEWGVFTGLENCMFSAKQAPRPGATSNTLTHRMNHQSVLKRTPPNKNKKKEKDVTKNVGGVGLTVLL